MKIEMEIEKIKQKLIKSAKRNGIYENFGQEETRYLRDLYSYLQYGTLEQRRIWKMIEDFDNWAINYTG